LEFQSADKFILSGLLDGKYRAPLYNAREVRMAMTGQEAATQVEMEKGTTGKLVEDLKAVVADAEELLKATADQTGERIAAARAKAEESLTAAKARLTEEEVALMAKTRAAAKAAEDYVWANPCKAMGITAAVAFVLGILVARR
jgi:ElaB/YqjD/DUF883 family membrane-anchored ribosome-binding protein